MKKVAMLLLYVCASFAMALEPPKPLVIGDKAPRLSTDLALQGEHVLTFEKGRFYIVEFWATWCGPCVGSIPHLNEIQKKYADKITILGIAAAEKEESNEEKLAVLRAFIGEFEDGIHYRLAFDGNGTMQKEWMEPAGAMGIPTAFVVDAEGFVAFEGHPLQLEKVLPKILDGSFDRAKHREELAESKKSGAAYKAKLQRHRDAEATGNWEEALTAIDAVLQEEPGNWWWTVQKMAVLAGALHRPDEGFALVETKLAQPPDDSRPYFLSSLLEALHNTEKPLAANPSLSERAGTLMEAELARLRAEKPDSLSYLVGGLASRYISLGRFAEARSLYEEALAANPNNKGFRKYMQGKIDSVVEKEKLAAKKSEHEVVCDGDSCRLVPKRDCKQELEAAGQ